MSHHGIRHGYASLGNNVRNCRRRGGAGCAKAYCFIDNDVKASVRAVQRWGFGKTSQNLIYLYVGTGIAASIIVRGCQIRGCHFNAGEVGHMRAGVSVGVMASY